MATPIRDAVDAKLAALWAAIQAHEDAFFLANGRYKQLLISHTITPADGVEVLPDIGTRKPGYEISGYPAAIKNVALPMALEIHQYQTPDGQVGYQAFVRVVVAGRIWQRSMQVGTETWRTHGWQDVSPINLLIPRNDLKWIIGIGAAYEATLNEAGVYSFAQLAKADAEWVAALFGPTVSVAKVQYWQSQAGALSAE